MSFEITASTVRRFVRSGNLNRGSGLLLYAAVALPGDTAGAIPAVAGILLATPMWWQCKVPLSTLATLCALAVLKLPLLPESFLRLTAEAIGPSLGLPVVLSPLFLFRPTAIVFLFVMLLSRFRRGWFVVAINILVAAVAVAVIEWLAMIRPESAAVAAVSGIVALCAEAANLVAFIQLPQDEAAIDLRFARIVVSLAVAVALGSALASLPSRTVPSGRGVVFWWPPEEIPEFRSTSDGYGWGNIGLWGELPKLLETAGFQVRKTNALEYSDLRQNAVVVLPAPFRRISEAERTALIGFVRDGGRLLLIGEHTNLGGVRDAFNPFVEPLGLRLEFDTTNPLWGDRLLTLGYAASRLGQATRLGRYLTHNRGASLRVAGNQASAIITGGWWHSDAGNAFAPERGFLSDYRLSQGDRIGDLVLAGQARFGQGWIVVWGDSSPFLNQNIPYNSPFLIRLFQALDTEPLGVAPKSGALLIVACVMLILFWGPPGAAHTGLAAGVAALAIAAAMPFAEPSVLPSHAAVISDAENNGFARDPFDPRSITGLGVWAMRTGLVPVLGDWTHLNNRPDVLFIINPHRTVSQSYVDRLVRIAEAGTAVVISGGGENPAFTELAARLGTRVVGHPLGSLDGPEATTYSAWRVEAEAERELHVKGVPIGTVRFQGRGRIIVLADEGFFYSRNIETEQAHDQKNQAFLTQLIVGGKR